VFGLWLISGFIIGLSIYFIGLRKYEDQWEAVVITFVAGSALAAPGIVFFGVLFSIGMGAIEYIFNYGS